MNKKRRRIRENCGGTAYKKNEASGEWKL